MASDPRGDATSVFPLVGDDSADGASGLSSPEPAPWNGGAYGTRDTSTGYAMPDLYSLQINIQGPDQDQQYGVSVSGPGAFVADAAGRFVNAFAIDADKRKNVANR